jgi:Tfp pilus assembly protein PilN
MLEELQKMIAKLEKRIDLLEKENEKLNQILIQELEESQKDFKKKLKEFEKTRL